MPIYKYCSENDEYGPSSNYYLKYVISLSIMTTLQIFLIIHSFFHLKYFKKVIKSISIAFFVIQFIGLLWLINDFMKQVIFIHFQSTLNNVVLCNITAYAEFIFPWLFTASLVFQLLLRLYVTFHNSSYGLTNKESISLFLFFVFPFGILIIVWLMFLDPICYRSWKPPDYSFNDTIYFCKSGYSSPTATYTAYIAFSWVVISNIFFGALFSYKLNALIKDSALSNPEKNLLKIRKIMVKNTVITISIVSSTLFSWILYFIFGALVDFLLYLDVFLNCLFIALMFQYNDNLYYRYLCKFCYGWYSQSNQQMELASYASHGSKEPTTEMSANSVS